MYLPPRRVCVKTEGGSQSVSRPILLIRVKTGLRSLEQNETFIIIPTTTCTRVLVVFLIPYFALASS